MLSTIFYLFDVITNTFGVIAEAFATGSAG
jgi:hypothetical protein